MIKQVGKGFNFDGIARKIAARRTAIKKDIGRQAVNQFKKNFRNQGFEDSTIDPWKARKSNYKSKGRSILIKSGLLRRSIQILGMSGNTVVIGTKGIKYAKRHNSGLAGMQKRQFIGNSNKLENRIMKTINVHIKKVWEQK